MVSVIAEAMRRAQARANQAEAQVRLDAVRQQDAQALRQSEERVRLKLESILSPAGDTATLELADIIDVESIQSLMNDFHHFARIPMAVIDLNGKVLVSVGWQEVCTRFHRANPQSCAHCTESNTLLSAGVPPGEFRLYKCKNNMWDVATPIVVGGRHVGNLFASQFFFEGEALDYDLFRAQARQYGFDEAEYLAALEQVPRLSREFIDRAMGFFLKLAGMISKLSYSNVKLARSLAEGELKEQESRRLNRTLKALTNSGEALMRAKDEPGLLDEICQIIVRDCGHAMVWIGYAERDQAKTVRPVAHAGFEEGYLESLRVTWSDTERGLGPTGTAIRTGKPAHCRDMQNDPRFAPWREEALRRGYASSLALPLLAEGKAFGAITIYATHPDAFCGNEVKLLSDLAEDLAYGITGIRLRQAHTQAEEVLRQELEQRVAARTSALHSAERYARSLIEASLDPLVTISPQGKITDVNQATELATGVGRQRLIGSDFSDYFTEPDKASEGYRTVIAQGQVRDYPLTLRHTSGRTAEVLYNATVYRNEAGQVQGVFAAARDITERTRAERRREVTSALLALFAQKTTAGDYLNSVLEIIRQWSGCRALGIRLADKRDLAYETWAGFERGFLDLEQRLSLEHDNCLCTRAISGALLESDRPLLTPGGSLRSDDAIGLMKALSPGQLSSYRCTCMKFGFTSLAVIPIAYREKVIGVIHLADSRPGQFPPASVQFIESMTPLIGEAVHRFQTEAELARHRDHLEVLVKQRTGELEAANARLQVEIAERRRAQEALESTAQDLQRSNRDLEQFAYVASHDLQEPLRAVGGYVRLLQRRFPKQVDAKALEFIEGAAGGAMRMERLITDLLAFSRVGTRASALAPADLNGLVNEALQNLQASIQAAHAKVAIGSLPALPVDSTQMIQLFQNLVGNAVKFRSERPPEVRIEAQKQEGRWVFSVRDNGIGIAPQYFERIFQIFQRLHTRKRYAGTGIGLAICKKIVERHGGAIWVESEPDQGSTFYFSIPETAGKRDAVV